MTTILLMTTSSLQMRDIEPEELAQRIVDMLSDDECRRYTLADLEDYYSELKQDSPFEYREELIKFYDNI